MRLYLAAPLFAQRERIWNRTLAEAVSRELPSVTWALPQDFRTAGRYNDARHYGALFQRCLAEIGDADAVVAILDGSDVDSGVAFETGFARALGKAVIGVRTDYRPGADQGVNLMCARACRYMVREYSFGEDAEATARALCRRLRKLAEKGMARP